MQCFYVIGCLIILACFAEWIREMFTFSVKDYDITSSKLSGVQAERRIIFLSDLHNYTYGRDNRRLISAIQKVQPDLILIGGDMLIGINEPRQDRAIRLITQLAEQYPVRYANGNHEQRMKIYPEIYGESYIEYKTLLERAGVRFLENEKEKLTWDEADVTLYGLEIPAECYAKFQKTELSAAQVTECIGQAERDRYSILLAHNPTFTDTYLEWGADLVLSGHFHGGIVRVPGFRGVLSPQGRLFPKYSGEHTRTAGQDVVVSTGLGVHTIPLRFFNPAQLVVLHMRPRS